MLSVPRHEEMARWNLFDSSEFVLGLASFSGCSSSFGVICSLLANASIFEEMTRVPVNSYDIPLGSRPLGVALSLLQRSSSQQQIALSVGTTIGRCEERADVAPLGVAWKV